MKSLSLRIAIYLLAAQLLGFIATGLGSDILSSLGLFPSWNAHWNDLAEPKARSLVIESLRKNPDGSLAIEMGPQLRAYIFRAPSFQFAAINPDTLKPLPGSSADLSVILAASSPVRTNRMEFTIRGVADPSLRGIVSPQSTTFGPLLIATFGYVFSWEDFPSYFYELAGDLKFYVPEILIAVVIGWIALKRGLEPLNAASKEAEQISVNSRHRRIPVKDIPTEIEPLVSAVNSALERLDEGAERQQRFLANAAHELRTPVAILAARLDHQDHPDFVNELKRDVTQMGSIIEQLLASVRLDKMGDDPPIDLVAVSRQVINDRALLTIRQGKYVALEGVEEPVWIAAPHRAVHSVIANLVDNAIRAEPRGGTVIVKIYPNGAVDVVDHGEGIDPVDRGRIFEPFWRKSEAKPGAGLGLAISKELVDRLGGEISIADTPGGGATFFVRFCDVSLEPAAE